MSNINSTKKRGRVRVPDLMLEVLEEDRPEDQDGPAGEDGLTVKQRAFVLAFTAGQSAGNGKHSAIAAGYSEKTAGSISVALLKVPHVAAAIDVAIRDQITQDMTARAVRLLGSVMDDDTQPMKLRAAIALKLADSSGVFGRAQVEKAKQTGLSSDKSLIDMDRSELEALVRNGAAVLKAAANLPPVGQVIEGGVAPNDAHAIIDQRS